MRDENYVFVTYATTTLNLYKVKNQKVTLIKTLPLIDLDMWDKDYRAGKAELTQDLKDGSIYANNYYLTVDNKNNLFGFYDNMIEKVGDKKVVEVSERRRMFDLDGNEREREITNVGNTSSRSYKRYLEYISYPNSDYKLTAGNFALATNVFPHREDPNGIYYNSVRFKQNKNSLEAYKQRKYFMGNSDSCQFGSFFAVPDIRICHLWVQDTLYLDTMSNNSTTTETIARTGTIVYWTNGEDDHNEFTLKNISYDKRLLSFEYFGSYHSEGENFFNVHQDRYIYVYDLKSNEFLTRPDF
jgi:hypothetical protein